MNNFRLLKTTLRYSLIIGTLSLCPIAIAEEGVFQEGQPGLKKEFAPVPSFAVLANELGNSVVNISVESKAEENAEGEELIPGLPFKFKGGGDVSSLGSGFIINKDGLIVTNNHVIEKAGKIVIRLLDDKQEYTAKVVGVDSKTDLALIQIDAGRELQPVYLGDSESIDVGDWVLAIGNQFQLGQTVTAGIVSAKSRRVPRGGPYDHFIQTDASINPGSSGGPLFNTKGQVVGINTAIFSPGKSQFGGTGFNIGIGFAVPINLAKGVIRQLKDVGKVTRGWLGVIIQPVTPDVAKVLDLKTPYGALVSHVLPGSPASKSDFKVGDVIVSYNGKPVKENDDLPLLVANTKVGQSVKLELIRERKTVTSNATIEQLEDKGDPGKLPVDVEEKFDNLGLILKDLTEDLAAVLKIPEGAGDVLVNAVKPGSLAEKAGFLRGDILEGIQLRGAGLQSIANTVDFNEKIKSISAKEPFMVLVRRIDTRSSDQSTTLYLTLSPQ